MSGCVIYFVYLQRIGAAEAFTLREFAKSHLEIWLSRQGYGIGLALLFAVGLTWLGALDSDKHALFSRFGYWTANLIAWSLVSSLVLSLLGLWERTAELSRWQRLVAATVIASLPMVGVTISTTMYIGDWVPTQIELVEQIGAIWIVGGAFLFAADFSSHHPDAKRADLAAWESTSEPLVEQVLPVGQASAPGVGSLLLERMPAEIGGDVICLHVEDHYVRVYTVYGNALVLMRFADALDSVAALEGFKAHRSWWVATKAIDQVLRSGRTARLVLSNGVTVPVSQPYLEALSNSQQPKGANA